MYLRGDEVTNHKGQCEHQHLHTITCHICIFLAVNINAWKWAAYAVVNVIIEVSATTEANKSDNLFQTAVQW
jgi:hypothetical protein